MRLQLKRSMPVLAFALCGRVWRGLVLIVGVHWTQDCSPRLPAGQTFRSIAHDQGGITQSYLQLVA